MWTTGCGVLRIAEHRARARACASSVRPSTPAGDGLSLEVDVLVEVRERVSEIHRRRLRTRRGGGAAGAGRLGARHEGGVDLLEHDLRGRSRTFSTSVRLGRSYMTLSSTSSRIARRPRAPVPRSSAWSATASSASSVNSSSTSSNSKNLRYCLTSAFFGSTRMRIERLLVEVGDRADDRQAADELGDEPELEQVLGQHLGEHLAVGPARRPCGCRRRSRRPCCRCGSR